ncbi:MAG: hypothetical protein Q9183_007050 [Haloplaca sp. 2 TL-2023]
MSEAGDYVPVDVEQSSNIDPGTYQLRQGLQRRIIVNLSYSSSESLGWKEVEAMRIGNVRLFDPKMSVPQPEKPTADVVLRLVQKPRIVENANGTKEVTVTGQWDSSLHGSCLLDRPTAENYHVQISLSIDVVSSRLEDAMTFALDQNLQIRPRSWLRPQSMFKQLWKTARIVHTTLGIFSALLKPSSVQRAADVWRLNSQSDYVKGEEELSNWKPRGPGLVRDYYDSQRMRRRARDVEATKVSLARFGQSKASPTGSRLSSEGQERLLKKCLDLWPKPSEPQPPPQQNGDYPTSTSPSIPALSSSSALPKPRLYATIHHIPKNPLVLKSSYLLAPTGGRTSQQGELRWQRHFAELRPPYLHIYAVPSGDEVFVINLRNARIDTEPPVQKLLHSERVGGSCWAVYGAMNTWLFAARSEASKAEWVLAIDGWFCGEGGA